MDIPLRDPAPTLEARHLAKEYLCWSKMHAESGEDLCRIISRKERERQAGNGLFFWGVGNAPAVLVQPLARLGARIPVVFSLMKGKPKSLDLSPQTLLVWRSYFDLHGIERPLPPNVLVTSRAATASNDKRRHFALICFSRHELHFTRGVPFDPSAYRNAGGTGAAVGPSQVTALVRRVGTQTAPSDYEANIQAELVGSLWVKLSNPICVPASRIELHKASHLMGSEAWTEIVNAVRSGPSSCERDDRQGCLF